MRHSHKYERGVNITYGFTVRPHFRSGSQRLIAVKLILDSCMAVVGLLMFGDTVRDEITSNILITKGFPHAISICITVFIAIIPLTKLPLK